MVPYRLIYEDATMRQGYARNVHLVAWFDAPTAEQMRQYGAGARALHERFPVGSGLVNLIVSGTPRFSSEVRDLARAYTQEGLHNSGTAHVVLVSGLLGSAVRGFLGTTVLLGRPPNPTKVFDAIDSASEWLVARLDRTGPERWDPQRLTEVVATFVMRA